MLKNETPFLIHQHGINLKVWQYTLRVGVKWIRHYWWECEVAQNLNEKNLAIFSIMTRAFLFWYSNPTVKNLSHTHKKRIYHKDTLEKNTKIYIYTYKYTHTHTHTHKSGSCSTICNSKRLEMIKMSTNEELCIIMYDTSTQCISIVIKK